MRRKGSAIFIIILAIFLVAAFATSHFTISPFIVIAIVVFLVLRGKNNSGRKEEQEYEQDSQADRTQSYHHTESYEDPAEEEDWEYSTIINCEYCGSRVDTSKNANCPHCGASYWDNPEWKRVKAGRTKTKKRSRTMDYDYRKECREAMDAGNRALGSLKNAKACLDSARNWGIFDIVGGGLLSGIMKRSKIKDAQAMINRARQDLQAFARELGDVHMSGQMNVEINDFIGFADLLWDNFLVDWMMQDRINNARAQVDEAIQRVEQIVSRLQHETAF